MSVQIFNDEELIHESKTKEDELGPIITELISSGYDPKKMEIHIKTTYKLQPAGQVEMR